MRTVEVSNPTERRDVGYSKAMLIHIGQYIDDQVSKGRSLKNVLAEERKHPGGEFWVNSEALRPYCEAIRSQK